MAAATSFFLPAGSNPLHSAEWWAGASPSTPFRVNRKKLLHLTAEHFSFGSLTKNVPPFVQAPPSLSARSGPDRLPPQIPIVQATPCGGARYARGLDNGSFLWWFLQPCQPAACGRAEPYFYFEGFRGCAPNKKHPLGANPKRICVHKGSAC